MAVKSMSKRESVFRFMNSGRSLNQSDAERMFGVGNLRATVSSLRLDRSMMRGKRIVRSESADGTSSYTIKKNRSR
jgi:hypothetical protein